MPRSYSRTVRFGHVRGQTLGMALRALAWPRMRVSSTRRVRLGSTRHDLRRHVRGQTPDAADWDGVVSKLARMATSDQLREWRACPRCGTGLEHGEGTVSCPSCGLQEYANPAPTASALVRDGDRLLLARRAGEPGKGLWDLVGGFMDEGEEPLETLRRELREETGCEVEVGEFLGGLPDRYGDDGIWTINFYWEATLRGEPQPGDDVAELAWFPREELPPRDEFAFANTIVLLERAGARFLEPAG